MKATQNHTPLKPEDAPVFPLYRKIFLALFLLLAAAQILGHPYLAGLDNESHFQDILAYPSEQGRHSGFVFSDARPIHHSLCSIDGFAILDVDDALELSPGLSVSPPSRSTIHVRTREHSERIQALNSFRIDFAASAGSTYYLSYCDFYPDASGIYLGKENGTEKLVDLAEFAETFEAGSILRMEFDCRRDSFRLDIGPESFESNAPLPIDQIALRITSSPRSISTFVDRVQVQTIGPDGTAAVVASGDFQKAPLFFDLPQKMGMNPDSRCFRLLAFVLLAGFAFLIDGLLCRLSALKKSSFMTLSGFLFLLLPLQGVLLFMLRACLALPFICLLLCLFLFAAAKFDLIVRRGLSKDRGTQRIPPALLVAGLVLYGAAMWDVRAEGILHSDLSSAPFAFCVLTAPLFVLAGCLFLSQHYPASAWLLTVLQYFSYPLLDRFHTGPGKAAFLVITLVPWLVVTAVHVHKAPRRRALYSHAFVYVVSIMILGCVELLFRTTPHLSQQWSADNRIHNEFSWMKIHPRFIENAPLEKTVQFVDRSHLREKPRGRYRIVCLGSSSTYGAGSSHYSRYSYPVQLEQILKDNGAPDTEVINGGVAGVTFSLLQFYFEEVLLPLDPDLVIIYFGMNGDSLESTLYLDRLRNKIKTSPFIGSTEELWAAMRLRWSPEWMVRGFLGLSRLRIFVAASMAVDRWRVLSMPGQNRTTEEAWGEWSMMKSPEALVQLCVKQGRKVILIPEVTLLDIHEGRGKHHDFYPIFLEIAERYAGQGVYLRDILDAYDPQDATRFFADEVHMKDPGYHYLAERIAEYILEEGFLSGRGNTGHVEKAGADDLP